MAEHNQYGGASAKRGHLPALNNSNSLTIIELANMLRANNRLGQDIARRLKNRKAAFVTYPEEEAIEYLISAGIGCEALQTGFTYDRIVSDRETITRNLENVAGNARTLGKHQYLKITYLSPQHQDLLCDHDITAKATTSELIYITMAQNTRGRKEVDNPFAHPGISRFFEIVFKDRHKFNVLIEPAGYLPFVLKAFGEFENMHELVVNITHCRGGILSSEGAEIKGLKKLSLTMIICSPIDTMLESIFSNNFPNLEELTIPNGEPLTVSNRSFCRINVKQLLMILEKCPNIKSITFIHLEFEASESDLEELTCGLKKFTKNLPLQLFFPDDQSNPGKDLFQKYDRFIKLVFDGPNIELENLSIH